MLFGFLERKSMKKLLIVLLCFYIGNVSALEYSDYSLFSDFTDKEVKSDEFTDVKVERRYKYYKLTKEYGPYEKEDFDNEEYPYIDSEDYTYTLESDYLDEKPADVKGRVITEHTLYHHLKADDINYIKLYNSSNVDLHYSNFNVVYKDKKLNYDVIYRNADSSLINAYGEIKLVFDENIDLRFLNITFDMKPIISSRADLYITLGNDRLTVGQARYIFWNDTVRSIFFEGIDTDTNSDAFVDYYSDKILETRPTIHYHDKIVKYTYKDILYHKYRLLREYSDDYLIGEVGDYIYKDDLKYKDYYAYRTRYLIDDENVVNKAEVNVKDKRVITENVIYKLLNNRFNGYDQNVNVKPAFLSKDSTFKKVKNCNSAKIKDENFVIYYFSYIIIIIVILILVLSKLYKKYIKSDIV